MANSASVADPRALSVLVRRGCCCGTDKHPEVDHPAQVAALRDALPPDGRSRLWEVDCLGPCERSNVVVVRAAGTRTWFGGVLDSDDTGALAGWIAGGAATPPPARLPARQFEPDATGLGIIQPLPLTVDGIADLVHTVLSDGAGGWSMGVQGAVAEFTFGGDPPQIRRAGRTVETR